MQKDDTLWSLTMRRFKTIAAFAKAIGWRYSKAWRVVNEKQAPDSDDIREMCKALDIQDPATIVAVFSLA